MDFFEVVAQRNLSQTGMESLDQLCKCFERCDSHGSAAVFNLTADSGV